MLPAHSDLIYSVERASERGAAPLETAFKENIIIILDLPPPPPACYDSPLLESHSAQNLPFV